MKITRENICHRYSPRGKSFEIGIFPVASYSHPLPCVLLKIVHTDYPIKIQYFHILGTNVILLSTPEGIVLLLCCLVRYSA
jgi:hypothetical protein